jgi:hypothetical protein
MTATTATANIYMAISLARPETPAHCGIVPTNDFGRCDGHHKMIDL